MVLTLEGGQGIAVGSHWIASIGQRVQRCGRELEVLRPPQRHRGRELEALVVRPSSSSRLGCGACEGSRCPSADGWRAHVLEAGWAACVPRRHARRWLSRAPMALGTPGELLPVNPVALVLGSELVGFWTPTHVLTAARPGRGRRGTPRRLVGALAEASFLGRLRGYDGATEGAAARGAATGAGGSSSGGEDAPSGPQDQGVAPDAPGARARGGARGGHGP